MPFPDIYFNEHGQTVCTACQHVFATGDWPACPHGPVQPRGGFEPHFDIGLGRHVTGWGDVKQAMRANKLDFRDHPSPGDQSVRLDKIAERKRAR